MTSLGFTARAAKPAAFDSPRRSPTEELDRAIDALWAIDSGCERERWVRAIMGAVAAGIDEDEILRWSQGAANFKGAADVRSVVRSIRADGGIGPGTLFALAREEGWRYTPAGRVTMPAKVVKRSIEAEESKGKGEHPSFDFRAVWDEFEPAEASHPYIVRKWGTPFGLRVVPKGSTLRIDKQSVAGWLAVPMFEPRADVPASLQFIGPEGKKLNAPGTMAGWFTVGGPVAQGSTVYVVEGIGQAWSAHQATGSPAVVTFGIGRFETVAKGLRERFPGARVVLVPDAGAKAEAKAEAVAKALGCAVVKMPADLADKDDCNDLHQRDGLEALARLLADAPQAEVVTHPLARFIELETKPKPPRWVLPGFIAEEMVVIAGPPAAGKTSVTLPLMLTAAGLHRDGDLLAPTAGRWRHCVFVTEDVAQAQRILVGAVEHGDRGIRWGDVRERLHIVRAQRMSPAEVAEVAPAWRELVRVVEGVEIPPAVVLDTRSAVLAAGDENDNAAASEAVATLREAFPDWPLLVIAHTAKIDAGKTDVAGLSPRGAGAWVGDGAGTAFILPGDADNVRRFVLGKTRNAPRWRELRAVLQSVEIEAFNDWGEAESTRLEWAESSPVAAESAKTRAESEADRKAGEAAALAQEVREAIDAAWAEGMPLARTAVPGKVGRNRRAVLHTVDKLISEGWVLAVPVPRDIRTNPRRIEFLVSLTPDERDEFKRSGATPARFDAIPPSWRKPAGTEVAPRGSVESRSFRGCDEESEPEKGFDG